MRTRLAQLRYQWRRIPLRTQMGLLIAVVAVAGLAWQHYSSVETTTKVVRLSCSVSEPTAPRLIN